MNKQLKLTVHNHGNTERSSWPVTQGVPFPDGELKYGTPVRVVAEDGTPVPTQSRCLATWNSDMKYVKWLLVDFQADLKADKPETLYLEYGNKPGIPEPEFPLTIEEKDSFDFMKILKISNGKLELSFRVAHPDVKMGSPDFFKSCRVFNGKEWHEVFPGQLSPCLYMLDSNGKRYDSLHGAPRAMVVLEESGPLRTCVKVQGYHATEDGLRFCPYTLRIHMFANRNDIKVFHSFIFDQDPDKFELREIGLEMPMFLGDAYPRTAFGGEEKTHFALSWKKAALIQNKPEAYAMSLDDAPFAKGQKSGGWASLAADALTAVAVIRDHWQEFPKGFRAESNGTLNILFWPANEKKLSFQNPMKEEALRFGVTGRHEGQTLRDEKKFKEILDSNPTAPLNLKSCNVQGDNDLEFVERMVDKYAPERFITYNDTAHTQDGTGAAKTTEFWLRFTAGEPISDKECDDYAKCVREQLIAPPEPKQICASGVVGMFNPKGNPQFEAVDAGLDDIFRIYAIEPIEKCLRYGMMEYGNAVCSHSSGVGVAYRHYYDKDPVKALRFVGQYVNEANDQIFAAWCNFLRTGERHHFLRAAAFSGNVADVCVCHAHSTNRALIGLNHYHNAHQWSGGFSPSHTLTAGFMLHYYLTGDRRLLDTALETADNHVQFQEPAGIISCRYGSLHRELTGPLWCVIEAYLATWNEKYGDLARRTLNWILKTQPRPGVFPMSIYTRGLRGNEAWIEDEKEPAVHQGNVYNIFREALRLFPSELLAKTIIAEADHITWNTPVSNHFTRDMALRMLTTRSRIYPLDKKWYWSSWGGPSVLVNQQIVCLAYELTGDLYYAAYADYMANRWFPYIAEGLRNFAPCIFTAMGLASAVPALVSLAGKAREQFPEKFEKAKKEWRAKREKLGNPVYDQDPMPGVPMDREHIDANFNLLQVKPVDLGLAPAPPYPTAHSIGEISGDDSSAK